MLRCLSDIKGFLARCGDEDVGQVNEMYFDDRSWTIRYFVVDTGIDLDSRRVLISPSGLERPPDWSTGTAALNFPRERLGDVPKINAGRPVSHEDEQKIVEYFEWPAYWQKETAPGSQAARTILEAQKEDLNQTFEETRLRSAKEVLGYSVSARGETSVRPWTSCSMTSPGVFVMWLLKTPKAS